jgi:hypothetical protein
MVAIFFAVRLMLRQMLLLARLTAIVAIFAPATAITQGGGCPPNFFAGRTENVWVESLAFSFGDMSR